MNADYDITISNSITNSSTIISFKEKKLNAEQIYNLFDYNKNSIYKITTNFDDIAESNEKDYFKEIISIISDIKDEINELNKSEDNNDIDSKK